MLRSARSRYYLAAGFWGAAFTWVAFGPHVIGVPAILVGLAVSATACAAIVERDERVQETIRLAWWAGTSAAPRIPRQEGARQASEPVGDPK